MLVPTFNGSSRSKSNCARRTPAVFLDFTERTPAVARGLFLSYLDVLSTSVTLAQPCGLAVDGPFLLSITRSRKLTGGYWSQMFLPFRQCVVPVVTPISVQTIDQVLEGVTPVLPTGGRQHRESISALDRAGGVCALVYRMGWGLPLH